MKQKENKNYNYFVQIGYGDFEKNIKSEDIFEAAIKAINKYKIHKLKDKEWEEQHGTDISMRIWRTHTLPK